MNKAEIIPFSNATEYQCWLSANCEKCKKYHDDLNEYGYPKCEIEEAIVLSSCGEGLTEEMAMRMGGIELEKYPGEWNFFQSHCSELQPLAE